MTRNGYSVPPPVRPNITGRIEAMPALTDLLITNATAGTVQTVISRVKSKHSKRAYISQQEGKGIRVWRTA